MTTPCFVCHVERKQTLKVWYVLKMQPGKLTYVRDCICLQLQVSCGFKFASHLTLMRWFRPRECDEDEQRHIRTQGSDVQESDAVASKHRKEARCDSSVLLNIHQGDVLTMIKNMLHNLWFSLVYRQTGNNRGSHFDKKREELEPIHAEW